MGFKPWALGRAFRLVAAFAVAATMLASCTNPNFVLTIDKQVLQFIRGAREIPDHEVYGTTVPLFFEPGNVVRKRVTLTNTSGADAIDFNIYLESDPERALLPADGDCDNAPADAAFCFEAPNQEEDPPAEGFTNRIGANNELEISVFFIGTVPGWTNDALVIENRVTEGDSGTCFDGEDNDGDDLTDGTDPDCDADLFQRVILQGLADCTSIGWDADGDGWCRSVGGADEDCVDEATLEGFNSHPQAEEVCEATDQIDNNCDGSTLRAIDLDEDGYCDRAASCGTAEELDEFCPAELSDCHDDPSVPLPAEYEGSDYTHADINPGAQELCEDGDRDDQLDSDCDPSNDEGGFLTYLPDSDLDGFGDAAGAIERCAHPGEEFVFCETDGGGNLVCDVDCNDAVSTTFPGADEVCDGVADSNCDGVDDNLPGGLADADADQDGRATCSGLECDDNDDTVFCGAPELCDGVNNDCDQLTSGTLFNCPAAAPASNDANADGLPDPELDDDNDGYVECIVESAVQTGVLGNDCDDTEPTVNPDPLTVEIACDFLDNDCDGLLHPDETDNDGDGVSECGPDGIPGNADDDCDDASPTVYGNAFFAASGSSELCDGLDNDCDGVVPAAEIDGDGDGFAQCVVTALQNPPGYAGLIGLTGGQDCNDDPTDPFAPSIYPGAPEIADSYVTNVASASCPSPPCLVLIDNQCPGDVGFDLNGVVNNGEYCRGAGTCNTNGLQNCPSCTASEIDLDLDGQTETDGDCDDTDPTVFLGGPELCDGLDNNCDGVVPDTETDDDSDGYVECWPTPGTTFTPLGLLGGDCDDGDVNLNPAGVEISDGGDNDCDSTTFHPDETDDDWDCQCEDASASNCVLNTAASCASMTGSDCDDTNAAIFTGATETCDGLDNDCDGSVGDGTGGDPDEEDNDGDGYSPCLDGDCLDDGTTLLIDYLAQRGAAYPGANALAAAAVIHPGAENFCDGWINDCSGAGAVDWLPDATNQIDEFDDDGDGFVECDDTVGLTTIAWGDRAATADAGLTGANDCADTVADTPGFTAADWEDIYPAATEVCDGFDNDCLGVAGSLHIPNQGTETDDDNDDYIDCGVDVNGNNTNPSGGFVDNGALLTAGADCNDSVATINPGEVDDYGTTAVTQSLDNDCDQSIDEDLLVAGDLLITEFDHAPASSFDWFEVYNQSSQPISLINWEISDNNATEEITASHGPMVVAAGAYAVLCINSGLPPAGATCLNTANLTGPSLTGNDELQFEVPFVGGSPAAGSTLTIADIDWGGSDIATQAAGSMHFDPSLVVAGGVTLAANGTPANWCTSFTPQGGSGDFGTPGVQNTSCSTTEQDNDFDGWCENGQDTTGDGDCDDTNEPKVSVAQQDCLDTNDDVNPSEAEVCDGFDTDCSAATNTGASQTATPELADEEDNDSDGHIECGAVQGGNPSGAFVNNGAAGVTGGDDCLDTNAAVSPSDPEVCDGFDTNCSLGTNGTPSGAEAFELDVDGDSRIGCGSTYGTTTLGQYVANGAAGITGGDDCLDDATLDINDAVFGAGTGSAGAYAAATNVCDGWINDCTGTGAGHVPANGNAESDPDSDLYISCVGTFVSNGAPNAALPYVGTDDCDTNDTSTNPGIASDGFGVGGQNKDNDCDTLFDEDGISAGDIVIEELSVNPVDSDNDEWFEIRNTSANNIRLDNWVVEDNSGGESVTIVASGGTPVINAGARAVICDDSSNPPVLASGVSCFPAAALTGFTLANTIDSVALRFTDGGAASATEIDCVAYGVAVGACTLIPSSEITAGSSAQFDGTAWCTGITNINTSGGNLDDGNPGLQNNSCTASEQDTDGDGFCGAGTDNNGDGDCSDGAAEATFPTAWDCDDTDPLDNTSGTETCNADDEDCDGVIDNGFDTDSDGVTTCGPDGNPGTTADNDCDDTEPTNFPGNPEVCDGLDNNCLSGADFTSGSDDELDSDGDGVVECTPFTDNNGASLPNAGNDCNDAQAFNFPSNAEVCDGLDNDCNGAANFVSGSNDELDTDGDGFVECTPFTDNNGATLPNAGNDCNDAVGTTNPGATESSGNDADEDCSGTAACFTDGDNDNFGSGATNAPATAGVASPLCSAASTNLSILSTDCNDAAAGTNPGATEVGANDVDEDCSNTALCFTDGDNDNFGTAVTTNAPASGGLASPLCSAAGSNASILSTDCNDAAAGTNPGATETSGNDADEDCSGTAACFTDGDNDNFGAAATNAPASGGIASPLCSAASTNLSILSTDCNDAAAGTNPGATEVGANDVDEDCSNTAQCFTDGDNDNFGTAVTTNAPASGGVASPLCSAAGSNASILSTDCNDAAAGTNPGATETSGNDADEDCSGTAACFTDGDNDNFGSGATNAPASNGVASPLCSAASTSLSILNTDCNDGAAGTNPGATETSGNDADEDCSGTAACFTDGDNDNFGAAATNAPATAGVASPLCSAASTNLSILSTDCNDSAAGTNPGATETSGNDADEDCSGTAACFTDGDNDNFGSGATNATATGGIASPLCSAATSSLSILNTDCNDSAAGTNPGATEVGANDVDEDCSNTALCFTDGDNDNFGFTTTTNAPATGGVASPLCSAASSNASIVNTDCNDGVATTFPFAGDAVGGDGTDEDCDGLDCIAGDGGVNVAFTTGPYYVYCGTGGAATKAAQAAACVAAGHDGLPTINIAGDNADLSTIAGTNLVFLGVEDSATEGTWVWDQGPAANCTATATATCIWDPGVPQPDGGATDNCAYFDGNTSTWFDTVCTTVPQAGAYACEKR